MPLHEVHLYVGLQDTTPRLCGLLQSRECMKMSRLSCQGYTYIKSINTLTPIGYCKFERGYVRIYTKKVLVYQPTSYI